MPISPQHAAERLLAWEAERRSQGKRAPASAQRPNLVSLERVAEETGIPRHRFNRAHQPLRQLLDEIVDRLGGVELEWDRADFVTDTAHLSLARTLCMTFYERDCHERGVYFEPSRKVLDRLFSILTRRSDQGLASPALEALEDLRGDIIAGHIRDGDPLVPYIDTALSLLSQEEQRTALPELFSERLCLLLGRAGLSRGRAAGMIGVQQGTFNSWCSGAKQPDRSFWPKIAALETLLDLEADTLKSSIMPRRLGAGRVSVDLFPSTLRGPDHAARRSEISRQMPEDFFERPVREQMQLIEAKIRELARKEEESRAWYELRHDLYALDPFPPGLEAEWQALMAYKQGHAHIVPHNRAPVTAKRRWRKSKTIETMQARIAGYLGFLVDHAPAPLRIGREEASLIKLTDAEAQLAFLQWKEQRQHAYMGKARITRTDLDLLTFGAALLSRHDGFVRLDPHYRAAILAMRERHQMLVPDAALPEAERERRDEQDLTAICNRLRQDIKQLEQSFRGLTDNAADHQERLDPLLKLELPLKAFYDGLLNFQAAMLQMDTTRIGYLRALRSATLMHLLAQFPSRRSMLVQLDYAIDNSGHFRFENNRWWLVIPVEMFKNDLAERFRGEKFHRQELEDIHGAYEIFSLYIGEARHRLLQGAQSDALFVSTRQNPRYSPQGIDNLFQALIARLFGPKAGAELHLSELPAMPIHGMRDLLVTAVLKATGSYRAAADAILDAESTIRRAYTRYKPSDRKDALKVALRRARGELD